MRTRDTGSRDSLRTSGQPNIHRFFGRFSRQTLDGPFGRDERVFKAMEPRHSKTARRFGPRSRIDVSVAGAEPANSTETPSESMNSASQRFCYDYPACWPGK